MKFCGFVASLYPHIPTNFGRFILIINKMTLIFPYLTFSPLQVLRFRVSASQIALTSLPMMSGPTSSDFSPLDYQVWGHCWSLSSEAKKVPWFKKCTSLDLICLTGESH